MGAENKVLMYTNRIIFCVNMEIYCIEYCTVFIMQMQKVKLKYLQNCKL